MVKIIVDKQEVVALLDAFENPGVPLDGKLLALRRLEYVLGRPILNTREFRKLRDEFTKPVVTKSETGDLAPEFGPTASIQPKTKRTRHTPTGKKGRA